MDEQRASKPAVGGGASAVGGENVRLVTARMDVVAAGEAGESGAVEAGPGEVVPVAPVGAVERMGSMDTLRGVAVLGILAMNMVAFGLPSGAYFNTHNVAVNTYAGAFTGLNSLAWWFNHLLFDQKMMAIFAMLFGAGVVLQDQRSAARAGTAHGSFAGVYYRRLGVLFVLGMVHAYGLWFGDILVGYALCGLLLYPVRKVGPMGLIVMGVVVFLVAVVLNVAVGGMLSAMQSEAERADRLLEAGQEISESQEAIVQAWSQTRYDIMPSATQVEAEVAARRAGWLSNFQINMEITIVAQTEWFWLWTFWRGLGLMLVGMALAKVGFWSARLLTRTYVAAAVCGYAIGLPIIAWGGVLVLERHDDAGFALGVGGQFNYCASVLVALAHASVVMLACKHGLLRGVTARLAAVGRMAFSNYLAQTVLCAVLFFGLGLGYFGSMQRAELWMVVLAVWAIELVWSPLWLARYRFGPAEWLWRSATYGRWQGMRAGREKR